MYRNFRKIYIKNREAKLKKKYNILIMLYDYLMSDQLSKNTKRKQNN